MRVKVRMRLEELLKARGFKLSELAKQSKIREERLRQLRDGWWHQVERDEIEALAAALRVGHAELFETYALDVFYGGLLAGGITIHLSTDSHETPSSHLGGLDRSYYAAWDVQAAKVLMDHAAKLGIRATLQFHDPLGPEGHARERGLEDLFPSNTGSGTDFVVGSQLTSELTERATALMFHVPPFDETRHTAFPYNFIFERDQRSAFGISCAKGGATGVVSTTTREMVAWREAPPSGQGRDCGLIVVYRITAPHYESKNGIRTERFIVVLAGHSGPGTYACAQVAIDPAYADQLYPTSGRVPLMKVVQATYRRDASRLAPRIDNRKPEQAWLVAEPGSEAPQPTRARNPRS